MVCLHQSVGLEWDALAVGAACGGGYYLAILVAHGDNALRHLGVVDSLGGLRSEVVAEAGGGEVVDGVADAEGEHSVAVAHGSKSQVGQGEDGSTLADISSVDMAWTDGHLCLGIALAHLSELDAVFTSKDVGLVEFF